MIGFPARPSKQDLLSTSQRPGAEYGPMPAPLFSAQESEYREMERSFHAVGGIASSDEVTLLLRVRTDQPISVLARWIVARDVLSFVWRSRTVLPLFQFDRREMVLRPGVVEVVRQLAPVLTDWEISLWFARANAWLDDIAPVVAIDAHARAVYEAARAERYLFQG